MSDNPQRCPDCGEIKLFQYPWARYCRYCHYTESKVMDIDLLRRYRIEKLYYSAEGLGDTIGRSKAQIYSYERGAQLPSLEMFRAICLTMKLTPEEVFSLLRLKNEY